jgi:amino acid transporter
MGQAKQNLSEVEAQLEKSKLRRAMGSTDLVLFYITAVVGLRWVANAARVGPSAFAIWIIAFLCMFVPLSMSVIELSSRYPDEGGVYVWSKRAFGDFHGFITGWTYWTSNIVYFPTLLFYAAGNAAYVIPRFSYLAEDKTFVALVSVCGLAIAVWLNIVGLSVGKWLHNASGSLGTWLPGMILIVMGVIAWIKLGSATHFTVAASVPRAHGIEDIIFWSTLAFGFGGLESASVMGEEVKNARRSIPRAVIIAGFIITFIYIAGTVSLLLALPQSSTKGLTGITDAVETTGERIGGPAAGALLGSTVSLLQVIGYVGGVGVWLAATARLPFVAGIDRHLPRAFGKIHARWGTPYVALLVQATITLILIGLSKIGVQTAEQAYEMLVKLAIIAYFIPFLYLFASLIKLQKEPASAGTLRVPGKRTGAYIAGALGFSVTAFSIFLACWPGADVEDRGFFFKAIFGTIAADLAIGVLIYLIGSRRRAATGPLPPDHT